MSVACRLYAAVCLALPLPASALWEAGRAEVDITPDEPVLLSGYAKRQTPFETVAQSLHASALALKWFEGAPFVIVSVDSIGVPAPLQADLLQRLEDADLPLTADRLVIHSTHTHSAPSLKGGLRHQLGRDPTSGEKAAIADYTEFLTGKLLAVIRIALEELAPAKVSWTRSRLAFARNRRVIEDGKVTFGVNETGPTDSDLPVMRVTDASGKVIALYTSYACHATTWDGNQVHGDWPGSARAALKRLYPEATALIAIGCAGDQNPFPRLEDGAVERHARNLAQAVARAASGELQSLSGPIVSATETLSLPFQIRSREEWEARAQKEDPAVAYQATEVLQQLDQGQALDPALPYPLQAWAFGESLLMIHLPGEVVVDYSLRLKQELGADRSWINAYSNGVPCYIPSERILKEGGYEADRSMVYYGKPGPFAPGLEEQVVRAARQAATSARDGIGVRRPER